MFEGVYTAIVTPFTPDGALDDSAFRALLEAQIEGGVDGVVPVGTTGESPTLNFVEHHRVIEQAIEVCKGRVKVIAGTGGNSTEEALELTLHAKECGADGTLQVTPYYNKPSQQGLIRHFTAIADIGLPVVLYNIPGRTGIPIAVDTIAELAGHPGIVAVKEAAGSVDQVSLLVRTCDLTILSGDDMLTLPMMVVGAKGVISVASNIIPADVSKMVHAALGGDWETARVLHGRMHKLFCDLFLETNPVPVKTSLAMMGKVEEVFRLPLCEMTASNRALLEATLREYGVLR
jgi:4-hydroxy-tetrahydrodipicolinate synthase